MANIKPKKFTKWLPPLGVTPNMRRLVEQRAKLEDLTLSELQRRAVILFLETPATNHVSDATNRRNSSN